MFFPRNMDEESCKGWSWVQISCDEEEAQLRATTIGIGRRESRWEKTERGKDREKECREWGCRESDGS